MHISCSNTMPDLPPMGCDGQPLDDATASKLAQQALHDYEAARYELYKQQLGQLLDNAHPEFLASPDTVLMCATQEEADYMRLLLDRRDLRHIDARVMAPVPVAQGVNDSKYWSEATISAKAAAWRAQQPKHLAQFTKPSTTAKARKAARKRAKAGRRASR